MPRNEGMNQTIQRREIMHYLVLIQNAAHESAKALALGDELVELARIPRLVLAGETNSPNPQAVRLQQGVGLQRAAQDRINELLMFTQSLSDFLSKSPKEESKPE